mmetsp:Transcript_29743/g.75713  ORF Transcript_29743/g.75713 Transcript_29743/m.75713 type:complete len:420 (-) Transcript_29743:205-1464(-)
MEGARLSDHLPDCDNNRLRLLLQSFSSSSWHKIPSLMQKGKEPACSVQVLPVTILSHLIGQSFQAELFIAPAVVAQQNCFLVGLRLTDTFEARLTENRQSSRLSGAPSLLSTGGADHRPASVAHPTQADQGSERDLECGTLATQLGCRRRLDLLDHGSRSATDDADLCSSRDLEGVGALLSLPTTLRSSKLQNVQVQVCSRLDLAEMVLSAVDRSSRLDHTVREAISLICDHARGGALVCIAQAEDYQAVFREHEGSEQQQVPMLRTSDGGYMTQRLRGVHISDARFQEAFGEFTEHTETDRWPQDYRDVEARNLPKDGAFLLDKSGFRLKCATKILGCSPPQCVAWGWHEARGCFGVRMGSAQWHCIRAQRWRLRPWHRSRRSCPESIPASPRAGLGAQDLLGEELHAVTRSRCSLSY